MSRALLWARQLTTYELIEEIKFRWSEIAKRKNIIAVKKRELKAKGQLPAKYNDPAFREDEDAVYHTVNGKRKELNPLECDLLDALYQLAISTRLVRVYGSEVKRRKRNGFKMPVGTIFFDERSETLKKSAEITKGTKSAASPKRDDGLTDEFRAFLNRERANTEQEVKP